VFSATAQSSLRAWGNALGAEKSEKISAESAIHIRSNWIIIRAMSLSTDSRFQRSGIWGNRIPGAMPQAIMTQRRWR
jgi:hypothetical protein